MIFQVITTFPEMIQTLFQQGVVGSAWRAGGIEIKVINPRDFTTDPYRSVDDRPYGGGDGMVMTCDPLQKALASLTEKGHVVALSPQGRVWSDALARRWAQGDFQPCLRPENAGTRGHSSRPVVTLICGRFAGIDARFLQHAVADEISIGDYVLSGGELAAAVLIDSIARQIPGTLGNAQSADLESFARPLLEGPVWTRPACEYGQDVPATLLQGNHKKIEAWRFAVSWMTTLARRPDLVDQSKFSDDELRQLHETITQMDESELLALKLGRRDEFLEELNQRLAAAPVPETRSKKLKLAPHPPLAVGLVHWPIVDKSGAIVCTNVTNLDIHDIARVASVYALDRYYIINPQESQLSFVQRILDHWKIGEGSHYNHMRQTALNPVFSARTIESATSAWAQTLALHAPAQVLRVGTSARPQRPEKTVTFRELGQYMRGEAALPGGVKGRPVLLLFGTGFGLAPEVEAEIDYWLEPIRGEPPQDYRHLSVRSAVSICLDRLLGTW